MRGTMQNSRAGISRHNDRDFDLDLAPHIDKSKCSGNVEISWRGKASKGFEEDELHYYRKYFQKALDQTNKNYIRQGHSERCRDMKDWLVSKRTRPEESIFQYGDKDEHPDKELLMKCYVEFLKYQEGWNKEHGRPFQILNFALHDDEATPHIHQRRVWKYTEKGILKIGQEKALALAGVELPYPDRPEGRYNNRKVAFDKMMREKWLEIGIEHGLKLEKEPIPDGRHHQGKEEYIRNKNKKIVSDIKRLVEIHNNLIDENEELRNNNAFIAKQVLQTVIEEELERER